MIIFFLYLFGMLIVGIITAKYTKNLSDFALGGRRIKSFVIALSEKASDFSAWLLIGLPGQAFKIGLGALWAAIGCFGGSLFNWTVIAERLRRFSKNFNLLTLPDYFEKRFEDNTHILRITSMVLIVFFFTFYVSAQVVGAAKILESGFGVSKIIGMSLGLSIIILYTILGGFFAVAWTDFFQGLIMVSALILLPILSVIKAGGISNLITNIKNVNVSAISLSGGAEGIAMVLGVMIGGLAIGLGYMGQPHILARYMALSTKKDVKKATGIAMSWTFFALAGAVLIGFFGLGVLGNTLKDPEHVTIVLAKTLLPGWLVGFIIAAAIAAMMSTVDSQLLVVSSVVARDLYQRFIKKDAEEKELLVVSRWITLAVGLIAFLLALKAQKLVYWLVLYAWGGLAASFGPAVVLSLWWKKTSKWGVFAGMIAGATTIVIWYNVSFLKNLIYELVPGFFISLFTIIVVSLISPATKDEIENFKEGIGV